VRLRRVVVVTSQLRDPRGVKQHARDHNSTPKPNQTLSLATSVRTSSLLPRVGVLRACNVSRKPEARKWEEGD